MATFEVTYEVTELHYRTIEAESEKDITENMYYNALFNGDFDLHNVHNWDVIKVEKE